MYHFKLLQLASSSPSSPRSWMVFATKRRLPSNGLKAMNRLAPVIISVRSFQNSNEKKIILSWMETLYISLKPPSTQLLPLDPYKTKSSLRRRKSGSRWSPLPLHGTAKMLFPRFLYDIWNACGRNLGHNTNNNSATTSPIETSCTSRTSSPTPSSTIKTNAPPH